MIVKSYPATAAERKVRLEESAVLLKEKFVGISEQIDKLLLKVKYWYLYPERLTRPTIINLWGPTGVGKTDLIRDLKGLLGFNDAYAEIMFSDHEGDHSFSDDVYDQCAKASAGVPAIVVLDEFQRYATKDDKGTPIRGLGYKDVWQVLSDGLLVDSERRSTFVGLFGTFGWYPRVGFVDHSVLPANDPDSTANTLSAGEDTDVVAGIKISQASEERWGFSVCSTDALRYRDPAGPSYINRWTAQSQGQIDTLVGYLRTAEKWLSSLGISTDGTVEGILTELAVKVKEKLPDQIFINKDYRKSLILVIGNLDSVYASSLHSDSPFIPADYYRAWSRDISVYDVKDSLSDLFFPEQVARLGNIHIIYPTLGEQHYRELIIRGVQLVADEASQDGHTVTVDDSVIDFVYRNGVYPLQGVRPVFTSIQDASSSLLAVLHDLDMPQGTHVLLTYSSESAEFIVFADDGTELGSCPCLGDRDKVMNALTANAEHMTYNAVHEAGHALMMYKHRGRVPLFCVITSDGAQTVDAFKCMDTFGTSIASSYGACGGIAAVEVMYGSDWVAGHEDDLQKLTQGLVGMVRRSGHANKLAEHIGMTQEYLEVPHLPRYGVNVGQHTVDSSGAQNDAKLVDAAYRYLLRQTVRECETHREAIVELATLLASNLFITGNYIKEIFDRHGVIPNEIKMITVADGEVGSHDTSSSLFSAPTE